MINDIFEQGAHNVGKSLFADDGALWVRGQNLDYLKKLNASCNRQSGRMD